MRVEPHCNPNLNRLFRPAAAAAKSAAILTFELR
jgi:hypothetical protein